VTSVVVDELSNLNMAMYCKKSLPDCNTLRKEYMEFMGSNVDSFCSIHQFPLITCPLGGGKKCSL
jgi:hypothetical protein